MTYRKKIKDTPNNEKKKIERLWLMIFILMIILNVSFILFTSFTLRDEQRNNTECKNTIDVNNSNVSYDNLNSEEKEVVDKTMSKLKKEYLALADYYVFTKNDSFLGNNEDGKIVGKNINRGEIVYVFYNDIIDTTLCHELLHSIFGIMDKEKEEWFVKDLEKYNVCYEDDI